MVKNSRLSPKVFLVCAVLIAAGGSLSACNTTAGLGQDVKATGSAISNGAENAKPSS